MFVAWESVILSSKKVYILLIIYTHDEWLVDKWCVLVIF